MGVLKVILGIIYLIICAALVVIVMLQESNEGNASAITGQGSESFYSKNKSSNKKAFMSKITIVLGILFAVAAVAFTIVISL